MPAKPAPRARRPRAPVLPPATDLLARIEAKMASLRFAWFVRQAWPIVEPSTPLVWGWYLDAICLHLEAFARGDLRWLIVNIPPRHLKTTLTAVLFPAWVWTWRPAWRLFAGTYAQALTNDAAIKARALIESPWYQSNFARPAGWGLSDDRNRIDYYSNTAGGHRFSTAVKGGTAGYGGDDLLFDDLLNVKDAHSDAERAAAAAWADNSIGTRRNDARTGGVVVIAQRLHEADPVGHLLAKADGAKWTVLSLPTRYDPDRPCITHRADGSELWRDPRTQASELLIPERFGEAEATAAEVTLGSFGWGAQHQQRPSPAGGGMFRRAAWRFWKPDGRAPDHTATRPQGCYPGPAEPLPDKFDRITISVDASFKGKEAARGSPDPVSITVWGRRGARSFLLERINRQMGLLETCRTLAAVVLRWPNAHRRLIEAKANGPAIIDAMALHVSGLIAVETGSDSKESRAWAIQPQQESGSLYLPDGAPWLEEFVGQFAAFPKGANDDDVDSTTQALRDMDLIDPEGDYARALERLQKPSDYARALSSLAPR